uniref:Uncharacterized protein n=1 Tax=Cynoglossus semilaevis TaxID=244447 RepID=A0A3P8WIA5_CYNSE
RSSRQLQSCRMNVSTAVKDGYFTVSFYRTKQIHRNVLSISIHPLGCFTLLFNNFNNSIKFGFLFPHINWKKFFNVKVKTEFYKVMLMKQNYIKKNNCADIRQYWPTVVHICVHHRLGEYHHQVESLSYLDVNYPIWNLTQNSSATSPTVSFQKT